MNILVAIISTFNQREKKQIEYDVLTENCDIKSVTAFQTNESILRTCVELSAIKQSGGINRIIALVSNRVLNSKDKKYEDKTAFEYYKSVLEEISPKTEIKQINTDNEDESPRGISYILNEICMYIDSDATVLIDGAGGRRTTNNVIQLLAKLLKYKGIKNPYNLYADINGVKGSISDTSDFIHMTELTDAYNEFMTTGKSEQLNQYFSGSNVSEIYKNLLDNMNNFSDCIRLGNVDKLDEIIKDLNDSLNDCEEASLTTDNEIGTVILNQFLPVIRNKLIGNSTKGINYLQIINWCINNGFIQQALTLFVEKMPIYLFQKKIIKYNGDKDRAKKEYEENKTVSQPLDWETDAFYTESLNLIDDRVRALSLWLDNGSQSTLPEVVNVINELNIIENNWQNKDNLQIENRKLQELLRKSKAGNFGKFKAELMQNQKGQNEIFGIIISNNTYSRKIDAIGEIKEGKRNEFFTYQISSKKIAEIYYGYLYVKIIRNLINHASSKNDSVEKENFEFFKNLGYDINLRTIKDISTNLLNILKKIEEADNDINGKTDLVDKPQESISYSTDLKLGDAVDAVCIAKKTIRIDSYNYDIPVVLNEGDDPFIFIEKKIRVEIVQISKARKICQTRFIELIE